MRFSIRRSRGKAPRRRHSTEGLNDDDTGPSMDKPHPDGTGRYAKELRRARSTPGLLRRGSSLSSFRLSKRRGLADHDLSEEGPANGPGPVGRRRLTRSRRFSGLRSSITSITSLLSNAETIVASNKSANARRQSSFRRQASFSRQESLKRQESLAKEPSIRLKQAQVPPNEARTNVPPRLFRRQSTDRTISTVGTASTRSALTCRSMSSNSLTGSIDEGSVTSLNRQNNLRPLSQQRGAPTKQSSTSPRPHGYGRRRSTLNSVPDGIECIEDPDLVEEAADSRSECSDLTGPSAAHPAKRSSMDMRPARQGRRRSSLCKIPDGIVLDVANLEEYCEDDDVSVFNDSFDPKDDATDSEPFPKPPPTAASAPPSLLDGNSNPARTEAMRPARDGRRQSSLFSIPDKVRILAEGLCQFEDENSCSDSDSFNDDEGIKAEAEVVAEPTPPAEPRPPMESSSTQDEVSVSAIQVPDGLLRVRRRAYRRASMTNMPDRTPTNDGDGPSLPLGFRMPRRLSLEFVRGNRSEPIIQIIPDGLDLHSGDSTTATETSSASEEEEQVLLESDGDAIQTSSTRVDIQPVPPPSRASAMAAPRMHSMPASAMEVIIAASDTSTANNHDGELVTPVPRQQRRTQAHQAIAPPASRSILDRLQNMDHRQVLRDHQVEARSSAQAQQQQRRSSSASSTGLSSFAASLASISSAAQQQSSLPQPPSDRVPTHLRVQDPPPQRSLSLNHTAPVPPPVPRPILGAPAPYLRMDEPLERISRPPSLLGSPALLSAPSASAERIGPVGGSSSNSVPQSLHLTSQHRAPAQPHAPSLSSRADSHERIFLPGTLDGGHPRSSEPQSPSDSSGRATPPGQGRALSLTSLSHSVLPVGQTPSHSNAASWLQHLHQPINDAPMPRMRPPVRRSASSPMPAHSAAAATSSLMSLLSATNPSGASGGGGGSVASPPSALYNAVSSCAPYHTIRLLIDSDPDSTGRQNGGGLTPLHCAIERYDTPIPVLSMLLESNPSVAGLRSLRGQTPVDLLWKRFVDPEPYRSEGTRSAAASLRRMMEKVVSDDQCAYHNRGGGRFHNVISDATAQDEENVKPCHRDKARKANAIRALYSDVNLREFWELMTVFVRAAHRGTLEEDDGSRDQDRGGRWRLLHGAAAIGCPPLLLRFAAALNPDHIRQRDERDGRMPLHFAAAATARSSSAGVKYTDGPTTRTLLALYPPAASFPDAHGRMPLALAIESRRSWESIRMLFMSFPSALTARDPVTHMLPFMAAAVGQDVDLDVVYRLLRENPLEVTRGTGF